MKLSLQMQTFSNPLKEAHLRLVANERKKEIISNYPCEAEIVYLDNLKELEIISEDLILLLKDAYLHINVPFIFIRFNFTEPIILTCCRHNGWPYSLGCCRMCGCISKYKTSAYGLKLDYKTYWEKSIFEVLICLIFLKLKFRRWKKKWLHRNNCISDIFGEDISKIILPFPSWYNSYPLTVFIL